MGALIVVGIHEEFTLSGDLASRTDAVIGGAQGGH
jgi:hypothetical protein